MAEVLFYHLLSQPLERALPLLLERGLARGWRAVVQARTEERLRALNDVFWTWSDESFLPHGMAEDGEPADQPVFLTLGHANPNGAAARFLIEGEDVAAALAALPGLARVCLLFSGEDADEVAAARAQWKALKGSGVALKYWRQGENGRWAEAG